MTDPDAGLAGKAQAERPAGDGERHAAGTRSRTPVPPSGSGTSTGNEFSGEAAGWVVQAGKIEGGLQVNVHRDACPRTPPRQLPADVGHFTGRANDLATLDALLDEADRHASRTMVVTAVDGMAAVGKTALAVHWGHLRADRFPDGALYVDLRGYGPEPAVTVEDALGCLLRELLSPGEACPADRDQRAALYRSRLSARHMLVVLDNARTVRQVRPLLPGSATCFVVVTSRHMLDGLDVSPGCRRIELRPMSRSESVTLLRKVVGPGQLRGELEEAQELAELLGGLPLALRIAAARVVRRRHLEFADVVDELTRGPRGLDALALGEGEPMAVRKVFDWSYRALAPATARAFRLLGLHEAPEFRAGALAALADADPGQASRWLDELLDAHMVEEPRRGSYRCHDLLRRYAAERVREEETPGERQRAARRMLSWYLHTAAAADRWLTPRIHEAQRLPPEPGCRPLSIEGRTQALEWCELEGANVVTAARHAARIGEHAVAWRLAIVLWDFFFLRKCWSEWQEALEIGLRAAQEGGDRCGEAWVRHYLGEVLFNRRRGAEAAGHTERAMVLFRDLGDPIMVTATATNRGYLAFCCERYDEALVHLESAVDQWRDLHDPWGEAWALHSLGETCLKLGRFDEAIDHLSVALARFEDTGDVQGKGFALGNLAVAQAWSGRCGDAEQSLRVALGAFDRYGDRWGKARTLHDYGTALRATDAAGPAETCWIRALEIYAALGDPQAHRVRADLDLLRRDRAGNGRP